MSQHFTIKENWPGYETAMTVFRYAMIWEVCRGKRVLELGAACGEGTALFADVVREVVAIDHQPDVWNRSPAAEKANVKFVCQDVEQLPPDWAGRFDVVIAMELIEHLKDFGKFQDSILNVLSPDGVFIFSTPNFDIYSDRGNGSREPIFEHHIHEYRASEIGDCFSDRWKSKTIMGLSQLSFPRANSKPGNSDVLLYFDSSIYQLKLGTSYPDYEIFKQETLAQSLPLEFCQSFFCILAKGTSPEIKLPEFSEITAVPISNQQAAYYSALVILQRRNEQYSNLKQHAANLEGIVTDRDRRLCETEKIVEDRENQVVNIKEVLADRDRRIRELTTIVERQQQQIAE